MVGQIFRKVLAYVCIVEFQKRGLPHLHTLVILHQESRPRSPDHDDKFLTTEIPEPSQTLLHNVITQNMIHGPCGTAHPHSPCMEQGKCTKQFPKQFCEVRTMAASYTEEGIPFIQNASYTEEGIPDLRYKKME